MHASLPDCMRVSILLFVDDSTILLRQSLANGDACHAACIGQTPTAWSDVVHVLEVMHHDSRASSVHM